MGDAVLADDDSQRTRRIARELCGNALEILGRLVNVRRIELHLEGAPFPAGKQDDGIELVVLVVLIMIEFRPKCLGIDFGP